MLQINLAKFYELESIFKTCNNLIVECFWFGGALMAWRKKWRICGIDEIGRDGVRTYGRDGVWKYHQ